MLTVYFPKYISNSISQPFQKISAVYSVIKDAELWFFHLLFLKQYNPNDINGYTLVSTKEKIYKYQKPSFGTFVLTLN